MKAVHIRLLAVLACLAVGAIIFVNAQNGGKNMPQAADPNTEGDQDVQVENIGELTNDDPWNEMDQLVKAYYNKTGVAFKGLVKVIDDNGPFEKVLEELPFEYILLNEEYYYNFDKIEVVKKRNLLLIADHANKLISVSNEAHSTQADGKLFDITAFRQLMEENKANAKVTLLGSEKILTIENIKDPLIQGYRIYYDPNTFKINKMLIGMVRLTPLKSPEIFSDEDAVSAEANNTPATGNIDSITEEEIQTYTYYMEIIYRETNLLNSPKEFKPENKFIQIDKNQTKLNITYSDYQLMVNDGGSNSESKNEDK